MISTAALLATVWAGAQNAPASGASHPNAPGSVANPPAVRGINTSGARRVTKEMLKTPFTARHLIGKPVYDQSGKRIGDVRDVIPGGPPPASPAAGRPATPAAEAQSRPGPLGSDRVADGGNATAGAEPGSGTRQDSSAEESALIIRTGGFAGFGAVLLHIPMSQVSVDAATDRLVLTLSPAELEQLKDGGNRYPDTTN